MGDKLDDEPNIPLNKKKISTLVSEETKSEETLPIHPVSNIPWLHKGSRSLHSHRQHTNNDRAISDRGSVSSHEPPNIEAKTVSTVESFSNNNSDIPVTENNIPFHPNITSTEHSREQNISRANTNLYSAVSSHDRDVFTPDQGGFPGQDQRPKEYYQPVLDASLPGTNPSSKEKHKHNDVEFGKSNSIGHAKLQDSSDSNGTTLLQDSSESNGTTLLQDSSDSNGPTLSQDSFESNGTTLLQDSSDSNGPTLLQDSSDSNGPKLSEESTSCVSDNHVMVDGKSTSLVITKVDLQALLQSFQDVLQQANDLQRRNETFLHSIRQEDRTSCEALQRRITETRDNFTRLESRIEDGDKEIKVLEEKIEPIVHKIDSLCKSFEKRTSEQNVEAFRGEKTKVDNNRHQKMTTNHIEPQTNRQENGSNVVGTEGDRQPVRRSHRKKDRTGSRRQTNSIRENESSPSKLDRTTDNKRPDEKSTSKTRGSGTKHREGHRMKEDARTQSHNRKHQTVISSSETVNTDMDKIQQKNDKRLAPDDGVTKHNEANQSVHRQRNVDDVKEETRSNLKSESREKRSESMQELELRIRDEDKSARPKQRRRKLKCSELGFKYRKTNPGVDNRIKVISNDVILRGGPTSRIIDNNIKSRDPKKSSTFNTRGAQFEPHKHLFGAQGDLDFLSQHSGLSALGIDGAINMTETDVNASNISVDKANEERRRGSTLAPYRGKGPDTVLLLDTSESMRGRPFNDMIRIAKQIIEGIHHIHTRIGIQENIGITVFGHETTVLRHLTLDYFDLLSSLDTLRAGGPSPFSAGFVMGLAALLGNSSGITSVKNVALASRVILISDGNATLDSSSTEELSSENDFVTSHIRLLLLPVLKDYEKRGNRVFCVPVGDANTVYFEDICRVTKGRIYQSCDVQRLVKMTQAEITAIEMYDGLKGNNREQMLDILTAGSMRYPSVQHDAEDIVDYIEYLKSRETSVSGIELPMHIEQDPNMPPIGTRVRRGPSWKWSNQDTEGPGTVIGHEKHGMIWIEWDNGFKNRYHYQHDTYDVKVVDEPRQVLGDQLIATGYLVKRGFDWAYGNQDGGQGNIGVVFLVKENGMVGVRWSNGNTGIYKYGAEGQFDIDICDPNTTPRPRVQIGRETFSNVQNAGNESLNENLSSRIQMTNLPQKNTNADSNNSRTIESYLPSVEEMNRKNTSSLPQASQTTSHSEERDIAGSSGDGDVKSPVMSDSPGTDYRVKWQYSDSDGHYHDYPGNVNGKIEATYMKRPGGTVIINVDGVGYRILFSKMQQVEINTKAIVLVRRTVLA
ncbi:uncharacterized protein LOC117334579 [Pecten maximus]|uniref:uncharacterized protein LOC117334579 n=1 Tax=Pecten maximus TaxID=6579 RepID=UPI00145865BF|nr:uncharacterized protein LOC117334579 [Pecten maximus]